MTADTPPADAGPVDDPARVGLLFEHEENRRQLERWLREDDGFTPHVATPAESGPRGDLLVVDGPALERHREWLQSVKEASGPRFFPVLLVHDQAATPIPDSVWAVVDDTAALPVEPSTLGHRLENLHERRRLSTTLAADLERSERRYGTLFEAVNDAILVVDTRADRIVDCNPRALEVLDYAEADLLSRAPAAVVHPDARDAHRRFLDGVRESGTGRTDDVVYQTADGTAVEVEIAASTLPDGDDVVLSVRDVTERRAQSRRLADQRDRLTRLGRITRTLHEATRAVVEADSRSALEAAVCDNLAESSVYQFAWIGVRTGDDGRVASRAGSDDAMDYLEQVEVSADDTETARGPTGRAFETVSVCAVQDVESAPEMAPWRASLAAFDVRATAAVPIHYEGELFGVLNLYTRREEAFLEAERAVLADLGETVGRAIVDIRAREEATLFQQAVEHAGHAVSITGADGTIEHVNPAFEALTGYAAADAVGRRPTDLLPADGDAARYRDRLSAALSGEALETELVVRRSDGRRRYVDQTLAPVTTGGDGVDFVVAVDTDVTDERRREQQLQVLYRVLRHNLRNQLNVIEGYAARAAERGDAGGEYDRIATAVEDLRHTSRQAGRIEQTFVAETDDTASPALDDLVSGAVQDGAPGDVRVETSIPETTCTADPELWTAVRELVTNAATHTDAADPAVAVRVAVTDAAEGPRATVSVRDDGPGIPENERRVLVEGEETPLLHGSGLGLWLVNWIVTELGGTVDIADARRRGSVVTLTVPVREPAG